MAGTSTSQESKPFSSLSRQGLETLLQAHDYAHELDHDIWNFAVELPVLQKAGLSCSDIRWLVCKGFANHARETTSAGDSERTFQHEKHLALRKRSCFVLTESGVNFIQHTLLQFDSDNDKSHRLSTSKVLGGTNGQAVNGRRRGTNGDGGFNAESGRSAARTFDCSSITPTWDCDRQELRLGHQVVKEFKLHSPNQVTILTAFEEEGWPPRVDDPLPPRAEIDVKQRLHDTIKSLNRSQKIQLIRFRGDGTGQGVRWELRPDEFAEVSPSQAPPQRRPVSR